MWSTRRRARAPRSSPQGLLCRPSEVILQLLAHAAGRSAAAGATPKEKMTNLQSATVTSLPGEFDIDLAVSAELLESSLNLEGDTQKLLAWALER